MYDVCTYCMYILYTVCMCIYPDYLYAYSTRSKANVFQFAICKTFYLVQTLKRVNLILKLKPKPNSN